MNSIFGHLSDIRRRKRVKRGIRTVIIEEVMIKRGGLDGFICRPAFLT